jgi:hypothetical protein
MTDLLKIIQQKIQNCDLSEIVSLMGYKKLDRPLQRLNLLLSAPDLLRWFDQSSFDFKYSNQEFIFKLGTVLNIPQEDLINWIFKLNSEQKRIANMFAPYIFIDTQFKRQNQPIFVLAALENKRRIAISKYDVLQDKSAELNRIIKIIKNNYRKNDGELEFWGPIHHYVYVFAADQNITLSPAGKIINAHEFHEQQATLALKGKE